MSSKMTEEALAAEESRSKVSNYDLAAWLITRFEGTGPENLKLFASAVLEQYGKIAAVQAAEHILFEVEALRKKANAVIKPEEEVVAGNQECLKNNPQPIPDFEKARQHISLSWDELKKKPEYKFITCPVYKHNAVEDNEVGGYEYTIAALALYEGNSLEERNGLAQALRSVYPEKAKEGALWVLFMATNLYNNAMAVLAMEAATPNVIDTFTTPENNNLPMPKNYSAASAAVVAAQEGG